MSESEIRGTVPSFVRQAVGVLYLTLVLFRLGDASDSPDASHTPVVVWIVSAAMFISPAAPLLAPRKWVWLGLALCSLCFGLYAVMVAIELWQHPHPDDNILPIGIFIGAAIFGVCSYLSFKQSHPIREGRDKLRA